MANKRTKRGTKIAYLLFKFYLSTTLLLYVARVIVKAAEKEL